MTYWHTDGEHLHVYLTSGNAGSESHVKWRQDCAAQATMNFEGLTPKQPWVNMTQLATCFIYQSTSFDFDLVSLPLPSLQACTSSLLGTRLTWSLKVTHNIFTHAGYEHTEYIFLMSDLLKHVVRIIIRDSPKCHQKCTHSKEVFHKRLVKQNK